MSVVTWNPFRELDDMLSRYSRLGSRSDWAREGQRVAEWRPAADIAETDKAYIIKAELPEVRKEDVEVSVHDGVITIKGERSYQKTDESEQQHRIECFYGEFSRSFSLPSDVDQGAISAESKDGILRVILPKAEAKQPKAIEVQVS